MDVTNEPDNAGPINSDDGTPLTEPYRGFFVRSHDEAAGLWGDKQSMGIFSQLALLAEGVGDDEGVHKWAQRGMVAARSAQLPAVTAVYADLCLVPEVVTGNLEAVIELAFETARTTAVAEHLEREGQRALWEGFDVDAVLGDLDDSTRDQANRNAIMVIALPFALHLAQRVLVEGFADTEMVERLCAGIQTGISASPSKEYAVKICDVFRDVFVDKKAGQQLAQAGTQGGDWLLQSVAYIGCSLDENVPLETAYSTQLAVVCTVSKISDAIVGLERRLILPFVVRYWHSAFCRQRFRFSSPQLIETELRHSVRLPVRCRIQAVLRTIGAGLGIKPPDYAREWLFEGHGDLEA